jgi:hypothetical protein
MPYVLKLICKNGDNCRRSVNAKRVFQTIEGETIRDTHAEARRLGWRFHKNGPICQPCYLQKELSRGNK